MHALRTVCRFDMYEPAIKRSKVDETHVLAVLDVNTESTYGQFKASLCGVLVCVCIFVFFCMHMQ